MRDSNTRAGTSRPKTVTDHDPNKSESNNSLARVREADADLLQNTSGFWALRSYRGYFSGHRPRLFESIGGSPEICAYVVDQTSASFAVFNVSTGPDFVQSNCPQCFLF